MQVVWRWAAPLALSVLVSSYGVVRSQLIVITVSGQSMHPSLIDGDRVLVVRRNPGRVRRGDVVVVEAPVGPRALARGWVIKRVAALTGDRVPRDVRRAAKTDVVPAGALVLLGDNPGSSADSRHIGFYTTDHFLGVVVRRLSLRNSSSTG